MIWILVAIVMYLLTTLLTIWLIHQHLLRMREDVREMARLLIEQLMAEGREQALAKVRDIAKTTAGVVGLADTVRGDNRGHLRRLLTAASKIVGSGPPSSR